MDNDLTKKAKQVLTANLYEVTLNGQLYRRTVPSREFYVHQWNWDSATHAMGLIHVDPSRAYDELLALISGQWENGLIAQITFNPSETKYFPGPQFWGTEAFSTGEIITSGITQPPLLAFSLWYVYTHSPDKKAAKDFLAKMLPAVKKYHHYLKDYRDPEDCGLLTVVHPWESGTDNSPRWDSLLQRISLDDIPDEVKILVNTYRSDNKLGDTTHRPGLSDYYRYMYLVHLFKTWHWDSKKIVAESPFAIKDVLFNSLWALGNKKLAELCNESNEPEESKYYARLAEQTSTALLKSWDDEAKQFVDLDVTKGRNERVVENTIAIFAPLMTGVLPKEQREGLMGHLKDPSQYWTDFPVPTTAVTSPKFELTRYWRGPTWPITNLFTLLGLFAQVDSMECRDIAEQLKKKTLSMISAHGFYEYFDPTYGQARPDKKETALGFGTFSWTAAIAIILSQDTLPEIFKSEK